MRRIPTAKHTKMECRYLFPADFFYREGGNPLRNVWWQEYRRDMANGKINHASASDDAPVVRLFSRQRVFFSETGGEEGDR